MSGLKLETKTLRTPNQQIIANYDDIQTNRELIDLHYETDRVIAELGIHIIGTVASFEEIENIIPTEWGDAYAVGEPENYKFYIWTRRSPTTPIEEGQWLDLGKIAIQGPEGPSPVMGNDGIYLTATNPQTGKVTHVVSLASLKGNRGATWKAAPGGPTVFASDVEGDLYLNTITSDVYRFQGGRWVPLTNIRGGQGNRGFTGPAPVITADSSYIISTDPQTDISTNVIALAQLKGEKGDTGDVGGLVNIIGILGNIDQLPRDPFPKNKSDAYLVGTVEPYELYIQVGDSPSTLRWQPMGPLNVATLVSVNGNYQNIWDADTKLDKNTAVTEKVQVYIKDTAGGQAMLDIDTGTNGRKTTSTLVQRDARGYIQVPLDPKLIYDAVPKQYVDNHLWKPLNAPAQTNIEDTNRRQWRCYYQSFICDLTGKRKTEYTLESIVNITAPAENVTINAGILSYTLGAKYKAATIGYSALPKESDWSGYWSFNTFTFDEQTDIGSECTLLPFRGSGGFEVKLLVLNEEPVASIMFQKIRAFVTRYEN